MGELQAEDEMKPDRSQESWKLDATKITKFYSFSLGYMTYIQNIGSLNFDTLKFYFYLLIYK